MSEYRDHQVMGGDAAYRRGKSAKRSPSPDIGVGEGSSKNFGEWLAQTPGIVSVLAVLVTLLFVVLNAGYVSFYEGLGVRPEDVGFDRVAVLARTAGLIPIAYIVGWALWVASGYIDLRDRDVYRALLVLAIALPLAAYLISPWFGVAGGFVAMVYFLRLARNERRNFGKAALYFGVMLIILLGACRQALVATVEPRMHEAIAGDRVPPIMYIDISAIPAHVTWLDNATKPPALLQDPYLLYLGHGSRGEILLACGKVVAVPSSDVAIVDGFNISRKNVSSAQRHKFCDRNLDS